MQANFPICLTAKFGGEVAEQRTLLRKEESPGNVSQRAGKKKIER